MKLPFSEPEQDGTERAKAAKAFRDLATEVARTRPHAITKANGEENDHGPIYPANFTKGLKHDACGLLDCPEDYRRFVEAINSPDRNLFENLVRSSVDRAAADVQCADDRTGDDLFTCTVPEHPGSESKIPPKWRGWESPRAGHAFDLEGPDAGAVGMAPAPRVGSSELAAEMAEVYALALLRDVPFTAICDGRGDKLCAGEEAPGQAVRTAAEIVALLNQMPFFNGAGTVSSTPGTVDRSGLNQFERNRRFARTQDQEKPYDARLTPKTVFRGSTEGALKGPYISQFLLVGNKSIAGAGDGSITYPDAEFDIADGYLAYGAQVTDQRTIGHKNCLDHMTDWASWLDVQNGANFGGTDLWETQRRFITTPRDLATYVHFDALYQAYLNACLILLGLGAKASKGFPEPSPTGKRGPFATFGGPHVLSLLTEVATRCLKAVRRQKFNYHRRARPEALGGRLTLSASYLGNKLGCAEKAFADMLQELPEDLRQAIMEHNGIQNGPAMSQMRIVECSEDIGPDHWQSHNLLLPMAFPEGSPMHPAYGAGHATVAGGCVTMIKAFFEMYEDCDSGKLRDLDIEIVDEKSGEKKKQPIRYVPDETGSVLELEADEPALTIQGELNKLAANISIGRNMAGVHYYSDYYDSLRMGERVAIGMLLEQAPSYGDAMEMTFDSFDGDRMTLYGEGGSAASLSIIDGNGSPVSARDWWLRHVPGEQVIQDL